MPHRTTPVKLQIVFQGGGARICVLMAVCAVLKKFHEEKRIDITRVCGASAGSIAATMLASARPIDYFNRTIQALWPEYRALMGDNHYYSLARVVLLGEPYFRKLSLYNFFSDLFCKDGAERKFSELRFSASAYYSDLNALSGAVSDERDDIPDALANSCRYPFAFSGFAVDDQKVDGGLTHNLPVDKFHAESERHGKVIAIGFSSEKPHQEQRKTLTGYAKRLFSTAIQHGVERSHLLIGKQNVFEIKTSIGTFDFEAAIERGFAEEYDDTQERFTVWLENWLRPYEDSRRLSRFVKPTLTGLAVPVPMIREINAALCTVHSTHAKVVQSTEVALFDEKGTFTGQYKTVTSLDFVATKRIDVLQFDFQADKSKEFDASEVQCSISSSSDRPIRFSVHVQDVSTGEASLRTFRLYFLFDDPLEPVAGENFYLECAYVCPNPYPKLGKSTEASSFSRRQGSSDIMKMIVALPRAALRPNPNIKDIASFSESELNKFGYFTDDERRVTSTSISLGDMRRELDLSMPDEYYYIVGREARNLQQLDAIGFVVE